MKRSVLVILSILIALLIGVLFLFYVANNFGKSDLSDYDFSANYDEVRGCYPINSSIAVNPTYNMECCDDARFVAAEKDAIGVSGYCIDY